MESPLHVANINPLIKRLALFGFAAFLGAGLATPQVDAQQKPKRKFGPTENRAPLRLNQRQPNRKGPPPEIILKKGKWTVQCDAVDPKAGPEVKKKRGCGMSQIVISKKNKNIGLSLIIGKVKQGNQSAIMMRVLAPIGVFLPTGIALEVDGKPVGRVPFTRCLPQTCMAFAEARKETLAKMKKGKKARFLIYESPGVGIPLELDLSGFTASLDALEKATP